MHCCLPEIHVFLPDGHWPSGEDDTEDRVPSQSPRDQSDPPEEVFFSGAAAGFSFVCFEALPASPDGLEADFFPEYPSEYHPLPLSTNAV